MMRRLAVIPLLLMCAACPGDRKQPPAAQALPDTAPANLESLAVAIPPAAADTFTPPRPAAPRVVRTRIPDAPPALLDAVRREQAFSRFCYEEFGQKSDPRLAGGVAMIVTVEAAGIQDARVEDDSWSSS
ncbi:MAG: hypothetical protein ACREON_16405, partial [Gemmatimonadaceae bacterium]